MGEDPRPALRERTRRAVQAEISRAAIKLFVEYGFEETTVDQVAAAAGMSTRSVFRYFATKEDMVVGNLYEQGHAIAAELRGRPRTETAWQAMFASLREYLLKWADGPGDPFGAPMRSKIVNTPALRAAVQAKHAEWEELLVPEISSRLEGAEATRTLRARAIVVAALACLTVVVEEAARDGGGRPTAELISVAEQALR